MNYLKLLLISTTVFLLIPFKLEDIKATRFRVDLNVEFPDHIKVITSHPISSPIKKSPDGKSYQISNPIGIDYVAAIKTESDPNTGLEIYAGIDAFEDKQGKGGERFIAGITWDLDGIRERHNAENPNDGGGPPPGPAITEAEVQQMIREGRAQIIHDNIPNTTTEIPFIPPQAEEPQANPPQPEQLQANPPGAHQPRVDYVNVTQPSAVEERYARAVRGYYLDNYQLASETSILPPAEMKAHLKQKHKDLVHEKGKIVAKQKAVKEAAIKEITLLQVNPGTSSAVSFDFTSSAAKNLFESRRQERIYIAQIHNLEKSMKFNEGLLNIVRQYSYAQ